MPVDTLRTIVETRLFNPGAIAEAAAERVRPASPVGDSGKAMIVAADHPARGALRSGDRPMAMADRVDLLDRLRTALARPGVTGVLATADILEDLLLLRNPDGSETMNHEGRFVDFTVVRVGPGVRMDDILALLDRWQAAGPDAVVPRIGEDDVDFVLGFELGDQVVHLEILRQ